MKRIFNQTISMLILLALVFPVGSLASTAASPPLAGAEFQLLDPDAPAWQTEDQPVFLPMVGDREVFQLRGEINNGEDGPIPNLTVRTDSGAYAVTNQDGYFVIQGLVGGLYEVSVESNELTCSPLVARVNVPPHVTNVRFTCSREVYPVTGTITNRLGEPLAGVTVTDNAGREVITDNAGNFVMELPAGIHTLTPIKSGSYTAENYQPDFQFEPKAFTVRLGSSKVRAPINHVEFIGLATFMDPTNVGAPGLGADYPKLSNQSLVVDRSGNAYITYGTPTGLQFGVFDGTAWTFTVLDAIDSQYAAMALGDKDRPQIAYFDVVNEDLKYIRATGTDGFGNFQWSAPQVVDSAGRVGLAVSIAINSDDKANLVYLDDTTDNLKYAVLQNFNNYNFDIETIQSDPFTPPPTSLLETLPSLGLDSADVPHISFYQYNGDTGNGSLMYGVRVGDGVWQIRTLVVGLFSQQTIADLSSRAPLSIDLTTILEDAGFFNDLEVDDYDGVHVAYFVDTNDDLEYAYKSPYSQVFEFEPSDRFDSVGAFASMEVDEQGRPHIAYIRQNDLATAPGGALKYAIKLGSENWKNIFVDNIGTVPAIPLGDPQYPLRTNTTIYLDHSDNPHILYYDFNTADLKYSVRNKWEFQVVGLVGTLTEPSNRNITLDSSGLPHIAFGGSSLYHGFYDGSAWQFELVDASATAGAYAAIEMDERDNIYIAYYDSGPQDLKFATFNRVTGIWTIETVDAAFDVGKFLSLVLDYNEKPHISYFDEDNDNLKYAFKPGSSWNIELLDEDGPVGGYTSIDVDTNNRPHVVYANFVDNFLKYIYKTSSGWQEPQQIPTGGRVRSFVSLELDSHNRPNIAYFEDANVENELYDNLKFAYHNGSHWIIDTIDIEQSVGWWNSMELDSYGDGHISYYDYTNGKLKYATGSLYDWQAEFVDDMGLVGGDITTSGGYTSLALDGADRPQFVYYDITNNVLKFAKLNSWELQTAAAAPGLQEPGRPNLGVDVAGNPHIAYGDGAINYVFSDGLIWSANNPPDPGADVGAFATLAVNYYLQKAWPFLAYYDTTNMELKYNRLDGVGWLPAPVVVDSAGDVGKFASLALFQVGTDYTIHIAYFDEDNDNLKYARLGKDGNGGVFVVDSVGAVGSYPSLALDQDGRPHITYYDIVNKNLMYAYEISNNNWHTEVVHANGRVGLFSSLAIDSHGRPHVAYFDDETDDLRYAYKEAGVWQFDVVDTMDSTGWYASLALDGNDVPHIAYYDHTQQNLKHAWIYRYNFVIELVDLAGDVGQFSSLQIDPAGGLHIAYYDATLGNLKYARNVDW